MIMDDLKLELSNNSHSKYDIVNTKGDFVKAEGTEAVRTGIITSILTKKNELAEFLPNYEEFGSRLHELVKTRKTSLTRTYIEEYVREALSDMEIFIEINKINIKEIEWEYIEEGVNYRDIFSIDLNVTLKETNEPLNFNFNMEV